MTIPAHSTDPPRPIRTLLVATMRNEGPYIPEWLAYHRAIGFTDIVICTNDCVDGSPALLDRLQALGLLTHLPHIVEPGDKPQLAAYARAETLPILREADWVMVLDADEFLNIHVGEGRVIDLIRAVPGSTAVLVNWRVFGSSGHRTWSSGFGTERYTRAASLEHGVNRSYKTLFTRAEAYDCKLLPHQPRFPRPEALRTLRYVDGAGSTLPARYYDESCGDFLQSEPGAVSWKLAQINHYVASDSDDDFEITLDTAHGPVLIALEEARAMRRADLLDGMTVKEASDADMWLGLERRRLARLFETAATTVLQARASAPSGDEYLVIARRFRDLSPGSARSWRYLLEALEQKYELDALHLERAALGARIDTGQIDDPEAALELLAGRTDGVKSSRP